MFVCVYDVGLNESSVYCVKLMLVFACAKIFGNRWMYDVLLVMV